MSSVSALDPKVKLFLENTDLSMKEAIQNGQLKFRIIDKKQTEEIASTAFTCFQKNARSIKRKSMAASVSGVIGLATLSSAFLNQLKGKNMPPYLLTIAIVAGLGFVTLWSVFRNSASKLIVKAEAALRKNEEDQAIELVAQGADLWKLDPLIYLALGQGNFKAWFYLVFLHSRGGENLAIECKRGLSLPKSQAIAKAIFDLGVKLTDFYYANFCKIDLANATLALAVGVDPNEVLNVANDIDTVKLAVGQGAAIKNPEIISLFTHACRTLNDDLIGFLIEKGAASVAFGIIDYVQWDRDVALSSAEHSQLIDQGKYFPYQLGCETPFECYVKAYYEKHKSLNQTEMSKILKLFKPNKELGEEISNVPDAPSLMSVLNINGIRVRTTACIELFNLVTRKI